MQAIAHYMKPKSSTDTYKYPWAPKAVRKNVALPPLPEDLAAYYKKYHHKFRFQMGPITFLSAEELRKTADGHTVFAIQQHRPVLYDPATGSVHRAGVRDTHTFERYVLDHRPRWENYES